MAPAHTDLAPTHADLAPIQPPKPHLRCCLPSGSTACPAGLCPPVSQTRHRSSACGAWGQGRLQRTGWGGWVCGRAGRAGKVEDPSSMRACGAAELSRCVASAARGVRTAARVCMHCAGLPPPLARSLRSADSLPAGTCAGARSKGAEGQALCFQAAQLSSHCSDGEERASQPAAVSAAARGSSRQPQARPLHHVHRQIGRAGRQAGSGRAGQQ
jgi:hypothetical protein